MEATSWGPTLLGLPLCSPGFGHKIRLLETVVVSMGLLEFWPPHEDSQICHQMEKHQKEDGVAMRQ